MPCHVAGLHTPSDLRWRYVDIAWVNDTDKSMMSMISNATTILQMSVGMMS